MGFLRKKLDIPKDPGVRPATPALHGTVATCGRGCDETLTSDVSTFHAAWLEI